VFSNFSKKVVWYGFESHNEFRLEKNEGGFSVYGPDGYLGKFQPSLSGDHNALNALAALVAGLEVGLSYEVCEQGIASFGGVDRRFEKVGVWNDVDVYDDYGHHPTEIRAVLSAFKEKFSGRKLKVLFQPHRYSRTQLCWDDFLTAFTDCDELLMLDIYEAGEIPVAGISSKQLLEEISHSQKSHVQEKNLSELLRQTLKAGDVFVTLGAVNVWQWGRSLRAKGEEK
jgi:UDP-N-acetylmuramate--alanine ligase